MHLVVVITKTTIDRNIKQTQKKYNFFCVCFVCNMLYMLKISFKTINRFILNIATHPIVAYKCFNDSSRAINFIHTSVVLFFSIEYLCAKRARLSPTALNLECIYKLLVSNSPRVLSFSQRVLCFMLLKTYGGSGH